MKDKIRLTTLTTSAGCAAKLKATELIKVLSTLPKTECKELEVGYDGAEDALVYNLDDKTCLLSTVDFFPPMVDDPYTFGEIAAANAISDIYAMGGEPIYALSLMCFPQKLPKTILKDILEGGIAKAKEAGIPIAGGHTIDDPVVKYGLAVTGKAKRGKIWRNKGVKLGDALVLTKPLGVGIINTAAKCNEASKDAIKKAVKSMKTLNKKAAKLGQKYEVSAATDVTGFGLFGHLMEMMEGSPYTALINHKNVPIIDEAYEYSGYGILPGGLYNNKEYTDGKVTIKDGLDSALVDVMYDPQTSGGLLLSLSRKDAEEYVSKLDGAVIIGEIVDGKKTPIYLE